MKSILLVVVASVFFIQDIYAQTWGEWFSQNKTQKKYLIEQVAALEVYIGYAKKGYEVAGDGLGLIGRIKDGDLNLHRDFFNALKTVNPKVKSYPKVHETIVLQNNLLAEYREVDRIVRRSQMLTREESDYIKQVFSRLLTSCDLELSELMQMVTDNNLEMEDSERLRRIEKIYLNMQDNLLFCKHFSSEIRLVNNTRAAGKRDIAISKEWLLK